MNVVNYLLKSEKVFAHLVSRKWTRLQKRICLLRNKGCCRGSRRDQKVVDRFVAGLLILGADSVQNST